MATPECNFSKDVAASWLLRLKEKHYLSQSAISDVVKLMQVVHSQAVSEAQKQVLFLCGKNGLHESFLDISCPFEELSSEYLLRTYLKNNFPYVVRMCACVCVCTRVVICMYVIVYMIML